MNRLGEARRAIARLGYGRAATTAVLLVAALLFARYSWYVALGQQAERWMYDARAVIAAPRADEDPRIVQIVYDDDTLAHTGRRSPLDRGLLARALVRLDGMGAKAIGIDMLIDEPQPEDARLRAALRSMRTPTFLGFTTFQAVGNQMKPWQEAFERQFFTTLAGSRVKAASIKLETDGEDDFVRSWPAADPRLPPSLVNRLADAPEAFRGYRRSIAYRIPRSRDRSTFEYIPIDLLDGAAAPMLAGGIAGRYVLIGGRITGEDQFDTPLSRLTSRDMSGLDSMSGLDVHATMLAQLLDDHRFAAIPAFALWLAAVVVVLAGAAAGGGEWSGWRLALGLGVSLAVIALVPLALQFARYDTQFLPAFGWLVGWVLAYVAARGLGSEQRRFAQGALGRYLPTEVAAQILKNPDQLKLHGERTMIYALFSDLEGFTKLTHAIAPETLSLLLNRYLDLLSNVVLAHGGTIDKFVGDAVVAFWGAPIARADDGDRALAAVMAMVEAGEAFRREAPADVPPIGRTRVGLHRGEAVIGNFGGEGRIQYTAVGDAMNAAARMEGANKALATRALVSAEARAGMSDPPLRPMGRVVLRGRATPVAVFEPVPDTEREDIGALAAMLRRFDESDGSALDEIAGFARARSGDIALAKLVARLRATGPGGHVALD